MATLLVNLTSGNLHIDSLQIVLQRGGRIELPMTAEQLKAAAPELSSFEKRGRVRISEDAVIVVDEPASLFAPVPVEPEPAAPTPEPEYVEEPTAAVVAETDPVEPTAPVAETEVSDSKSE
jgi:hypothetical protein